MVADRAAVLAWFEPRRRAYPWRRARDPYRVLVSEIMLQQTQAARVAEAYPRFLRRFPSVRALAAASRRDVLVAWDGLGYNRRAVALAEAARAIVREHGGRIPRDPVALRTLPGVGPYTAAAVASIAFGVPVAAVDTNVRRVISRAAGGVEDLGDARVRELAQVWLDPGDPGGWNQALMDLGREVCRPAPRCDACPLRTGCRWVGVQADPPSRPSRRTEPFAGSMRQVRGAVVRALRTRPSATVAELAAALREPEERVREAVRRLVVEGILERRGAHVLLAS
ncbi:MAG: adenine glycosylase [Actinomycetota bacterium]|nr:MAG: adenine glycosylase [Actinomycetota bacterium]